MNDLTTKAGGAVPGVHRLIRAIGPGEGPFAGDLVEHRDGAAVSVDIAELSGWPGWVHSGSEHVAGALDIVRRSDGHDVLLPHCTERLSVLLGRRAAAGVVPAAGEIVTLTISLLRGLRELVNGEDAAGDWWLTDDGRPLFVHGAGTPARTASAVVLERVLEQTTDRTLVRILGEVLGALERPRHSAADDAAWEAALFAHAAPRALRRDRQGSDADEGDVARMLRGSAVRGHATQSRGATRRSLRDAASHGALTRLRAVVRKRTHDTVRREGAGGDRVRAGRGRVHAGDDGVRAARGRMRAAGDRLWGIGSAARDVRTPARSGAVRSRTRSAGRFGRSSPRAKLVAAAGAAIVVLTVGLLWPDGGEGAQAEPDSIRGGEATAAPDAEGSRPSASTSPGTAGAAAPVDPGSGAASKGEPTPEPGPQTSEPSEPSGGPDAAVPGLLEAVTHCLDDDDAVCPAAVAEGYAVRLDGVMARGTDGVEAQLVEDYGDVAVVRLLPTDPAVGAQMLVIERREDKWLVRDVFDVADQPE